MKLGRVAGLAFLTMVLWAALFPGRRYAQTDDTENGNLHRADPCTHAPDPQGEAVGITRRCGAGGSAGILKGDFNGDGIADLAIGTPTEERSDSFTFLGRTFTVDNTGAGAVSILYGSSFGLTAAGNQEIDAGYFNNTHNGFFGTAMAAGRFKSLTQPYSDLAVGAPGTLHNGFRSGAVMVYNGSANGLVGAQTLFADQFSAAGTSIGGGATLTFPNDMTMAWGDFDGDGIGDLAVSVIPANTSISAVLIIFGSSTGLDPNRYQVIVVNDIVAPVTQVHTAGCFLSCFKTLGTVTVSAGALKSNGRDQLLIGAPECFVIDDSGVRQPGPPGCVIKQISDNLLDTNLPGFWSVFYPGYADGREPDDGFGSSLAVGDFDGNGTKDVAVGAPNASADVGAVWVFKDASSAHFQLLTPSTAGLSGSQTNELFGAALAANDFNGDGFTDLAIGAPGATSGNGTANPACSPQCGMGLVNVIYGSSNGLDTAASTGHPAAQGFIGNGQFGAALSAWNFGGAPQADLAVGVPLYTFGIYSYATLPPKLIATIPGAGAVEVLYGSAPGGLSSPSQVWTHQSLTGFVPQSGLHFGAALY